MYFIVVEFHLVVISIPKQTTYFVSLRVEIAVRYSKITEDIVLSSPDSHFCVPKNYIVVIVYHPSNYSLVPRVFIWIVSEVVQFVAFTTIKRNYEPLLSHLYPFVVFARVVARK